LTAKTGYRLNKCLLKFSRRAADDAIAEGRVTVNGDIVVTAGRRVESGDEVCVDGEVQEWERVAEKKKKAPSARDFLYLKYWKPRGQKPY
jgi:23S rRNA pseudouridine2604 synthase